MTGTARLWQGLAGLASVLLGACTDGLPGAGGATLPSTRLAEGAVIVAGPPGYCVDRRTLRPDAAGGFAILAACAEGDGAAPGLVTVTVGSADETGLPTPEALAESLRATLLEGTRRDGMLIAHLGGGPDSPIDGGDDRHWRAAFEMDGRLIALALYAPEGGALAGAAGAGVLAAVRDRIVGASAAATAQPDA